jgi:diguanylate cyclase (GGDEF)-like protein
VPERLLVVVLGAVLIVRLVVRRAVSRAWEVAGFVALTLALLGHAVLALQKGGLGAETLLSSGLWLYLVYVYAFYVLPVPAARLVAGATWATTLAAAVLAELGSPRPGVGIVAFVQYQAGGLVAIVLASALASWRTALGEANERAQQARRESLTDLLTGQWNRRALELAIGREVARSRRTGVPFSLILLDVDHFKALNDVHGHAAGDAVLMEVASVVRGGLRAGDELGRWGGEEFMVVAPDTRPDEALKLSERLRVRLQGHRWPRGSVTASFGVTAYRRGDDLEPLFERADEALYRAKQMGRNRCDLVLAGSRGTAGPASRSTDAEPPPARP